MAGVARNATRRGISLRCPRPPSATWRLDRARLLLLMFDDPWHVVRAAMIGAHCATPAAGGLLKPPLTDVGLERFLADAKRARERAK